MSAHQYVVYDARFIIINDVNKSQLPHVIDASHTTHATHVNWWSYVIKTDWLETLSVFLVGPVHTRDHGPDFWR